MSGTSIPYYLRPNKAVDRYAFIELLQKINRFSPINQYKYIGFGGHSLEDFKYLHSQFGIGEIISIEQDEQTFKRQEFNLPYSCIQCIYQNSAEFIDNFNRNQKSIIWLDYVEPKYIKNQMEEYQNLLEKLEPTDILKITINAHSASYYTAGKSSTEIHQKRKSALQEKLGDELFPTADIQEKMMTAKGFPKALSLIIKYATQDILKEKTMIFQPLTIFSYADGQTMLTVTGIILEKNKREKFLKTTAIEHWELANLDWSPPRSVNVPDLTIRERLFIDSKLPHATAEEIQHELGFLFNVKPKVSLEMLNNYILFYRYSPYFSRILV